MLLTDRVVCVCSRDVSARQSHHHSKCDTCSSIGHNVILIIKLFGQFHIMCHMIEVDICRSEASGATSWQFQTHAKSEFKNLLLAASKRRTVDCAGVMKIETRIIPPCMT